MLDKKDMNFSPFYFFEGLMSCLTLSIDLTKQDDIRQTWLKPHVSSQHDLRSQS